MQIKHFLKISAFVVATTLLTTSCAYRAPLTQGNYVEQDLVNQLAVGMTKEQVRYLLGTPMVIDPYDSTRWYYVHFSRVGWEDPKVQNLVLLFNGDSLVDMSGDFPKPTTFDSGTGVQNPAASPDFELPKN